MIGYEVVRGARAIAAMLDIDIGPIKVAYSAECARVRTKFWRLCLVALLVAS